jgi:hypothetical protein
VQPEVLSQIEHAVSDIFGSSPARASVSFVGVEPIEVLRFAVSDTGTGAAAVTLLTLGMSRRPMGEGDGPRAELLVRLHSRPVNGGEMWRRLAVLAAAPVVEGVVYSAGMSVDLGEPLDPMSICTGGVIEESELPALMTDAGEVTILRFIPATSSELAFSRVKGTGALGDRWRESSTDLLDLGRAEVKLG